MKKIAFTMCMASLFAVGACKGGGSKCDEAIGKVMGMTLEMAESMASLAGDDAKIAEAKKQMQARVDEAMPEAIKRCETLVKENPEAEKALDCIIDSADMEALKKCDDSALKSVI